MYIYVQAASIIKKVVMKIVVDVNVCYVSSVKKYVMCVLKIYVNVVNIGASIVMEMYVKIVLLMIKINATSVKKKNKCQFKFINKMSANICEYIVKCVVEHLKENDDARNELNVVNKKLTLSGILACDKCEFYFIENDLYDCRVCGCMLCIDCRELRYCENCRESVCDSCFNKFEEVCHECEQNE